MYLLFLFILIFFIILLFISYFFGSKHNNSAVSTILLVFLGCAMSWVSICGISQSVLDTSMQEVSNVQIYSLNSDSQVSGHFLIGSGSINEEMYYYYYVKGDYGYQIEKLNAKDVEIVERDDEELFANIITYKKMLVEENYFVAFGKNIFELNYKVIIYVPKGTINIIYNVSL